MDKNFKPREVWVAKNAPVPDFMRRHIQNNGKLYMTVMPRNHKAIISIHKNPDNASDTVSIDVKYVRQEVKIKDESLLNLTYEIRHHVLEGGKLYMYGEPECGIAFISAENDSSGENSLSMYILESDFMDEDEQEFTDAVAGILTE